MNESEMWQDSIERIESARRNVEWWKESLQRAIDRAFGGRYSITSCQMGLDKAERDLQQTIKEEEYRTLLRQSKGLVEQD